MTQLTVEFLENSEIHRCLLGVSYQELKLLKIQSYFALRHFLSPSDHFRTLKILLKGIMS